MPRNISLSTDLQIDILGDPHLGRVFKTGVPLHRMGEREAEQFKQFARDLIQSSHDTHVCLGDLFDKFRVSNEVVLATATAYEEAARLNPGTTYIVLQGNHDSSRDNEKVSSFSIFERIVSKVPNIKVLVDIPLVHKGMLFMPWTPFQSSQESVDEALKLKISSNFKVVFAHWDIDDYGNEDATHVLPIESLKKITDLVVMGHFHKSSDSVIKGLRVVTWGSMQPYAHGEEATPSLYLSHTVSQVEENLGSDENFYSKNCLRILLDQGEKPLAGIECRALTHKRLDAPDSVQDLDVSVDEFSLESVFKSTFEEMGVEPSLANQLFTKI